MYVSSSQLNCFFAAAKFLNFTKAAQYLSLTQPILSRQIAMLEQEMGLQLFYRDRNSILLTEAGKVFEEGMCTLYQEHQELLERAAQEHQKEQNILKIGMIEGQLHGRLYTKSFANLWLSASDIESQIVYYPIAAMEDALLEGKIDVAIVFSEQLEVFSNNIDSKTLQCSENCLVVPNNHKLAGIEDPQLIDFKDETFVLLKNTGSVDACCRRNGFEPKIRVVPDLGTLSLWIESGLGITVLNPWHSFSYSPKMHCIPFKELGTVCEFAAWLRDIQNPLIKVFLEAI
jgi:DNA-binding transcriptional LysR family regulator